MTAINPMSAAPQAKAQPHGRGLAHVMPAKVLVGVWAALVLLTVVTVAVTKIDLGSPANLVIAMVIATIKAALVCLFFMHLLYDKKLNLLIFVGSILFVLLFVTFTLVDTTQYQPDIRQRTEVIEQKAG